MPSYTFYKSDGTITSRLTCSEDDLVHNLREGENYIQGDYDAFMYEIVNGVPIQRTQEEADALLLAMAPVKP